MGEAYIQQLLRKAFEGFSQFGATGRLTPKQLQTPQETHGWIANAMLDDGAFTALRIAKFHQ